MSASASRLKRDIEDALSARCALYVLDSTIGASGCDRYESGEGGPCKRRCYMHDDREALARRYFDAKRIRKRLNPKK